MEDAEMDIATIFDHFYNIGFTSHTCGNAFT